MKKILFFSKLIIILCLNIFINLPACSIEDNYNNIKPYRNYILGPSDVLSIYVYDFPEFDQEKIKVAPDGILILSNVGNINVTGMPLNELHNVVREKLKFYLKDPRITIKLEKTKPTIVYVNGAVQKPGSYELNTDPQNPVSKQGKNDVIIERKTPLLSNILVAAGGVKYNADLENISIKNSLTGKEFKINLLGLLEGDTNQDVYLLPRDVVNVPELPTSYGVSDSHYKKFVRAVFSPGRVPVKVLGYVNNPGLIYLNTSDSLNLNAAISSAGGYFDRNESQNPPKKVYISRTDKNGKLTTKVVNPMENDLMLRPNDVIYVPETTRPVIVKMFKDLERIIRPIHTFADTYNEWSLIWDPERFMNNRRN